MGPLPIFLLSSLALIPTGSAVTLRSWGLAPAGADHGTRHKRVVGGSDAVPGEIPYQVLITNRETNFTCGGTIIDPYYVLTARHCVLPKSQYKKLDIVAGIVSIDQLDKIHNNVLKIFLHPKSRNNYMKGDIALLKMQYSFENYLSVSSIPLRLNVNYEGENCTVSGWGVTQSDGTIPKNLQVAHIRVYSRKECFRMYHKRMASDLLCAGDVNGTKDSCQGDSGGPLVCNGLLTGVVKNGYRCGEPNYPGKYTEVALYVHWIAKKIGKDAHRIGFW